MMQRTHSRRTFLAMSSSLAATLMLGSRGAHAQKTPTLDAIKRRGAVRIGWAVWYPYVFRDPQNNEISGIMPMYMADMARALGGVKVDWVEDSTATLIAGLQADKFDLTSVLGITPQRAQSASFTDPLLADGTALAGLKSRLGNRSGWETFNANGVRISVTLGSNTDLYVTDKFKNAEVVRFRTEPESIAAVLAGRVDVMAIGRGSSGVVLKQRPELALVPDSLFQSYPIAPVVQKDNEAFRDWLNRFSVEQKTNGRLLKIIEPFGLDKNSIPA
jgi:polar amino acid transport system substrate-binding protein